jgi:mono/diheme cytochrome c family protein
MKKTFLFISIISCVLLLTQACGSPRRGAPFAAPLEIDTPSLAKGQEVFMRHCHPCHPGGEAGVGPALNQKPLPGSLIGMQVRRGLGAMPSFSKEQISDQELNDLIDYLYDLRAHDG